MLRLIVISSLLLLLSACNPAPMEETAQTATLQPSASATETTPPTVMPTATDSPEPTLTATEHAAAPDPEETSLKSVVVNRSSMFPEMPMVVKELKDEIDRVNNDGDDKTDINDINVSQIKEGILFAELEKGKVYAQVDPTLQNTFEWKANVADIRLLKTAPNGVLNTIMVTGYNRDRANQPNLLTIFSPADGIKSGWVNGQFVESTEEFNLLDIGASESEAMIVTLLEFLEGQIVTSQAEWDQIKFSTMIACREARGGCPGGIEINFQKGDTVYVAMSLKQAVAYFCDPTLPDNERISQEEVEEFYKTYVNGYGENANIKFVE